MFTVHIFLVIYLLNIFFLLFHFFFFIYFMFYQITRLVAGKPSFRIDLSKQAKEIVSELLNVYRYLMCFTFKIWIIG